MIATSRDSGEISCGAAALCSTHHDLTKLFDDDFSNGCEGEESTSDLEIKVLLIKFFQVLPYLSMPYKTV